MPPPSPPFSEPKTSTMPSNVDKLIQELSKQMQTLAPAKETLVDNVDAYETGVDQDLSSVVHTYGTHGLGIDLTVEAWPHLEQVFSGGDDHMFEYFDRP
jgi:hypothetical protein